MAAVIVWNEHRHERDDPEVAERYPEGIHGLLAGVLTEAGHDTATATLDEPEHGLTDAALDATDVLVWWGHRAHEEVTDAVVDRVQQRVLDGMGLVVLHSGHYAKVFRRLMGTGCMLKWRKPDRERLWVVDHGHPIVAGLPESFELDPEEMYGEPFQVPPPDELVLVSWFAGGEVFRSGCTWRRGRGRVVYLRPGDESYPTYHHPLVQRLISNAVGWAAPGAGPAEVIGRAPAQEREPAESEEQR